MVRVFILALLALFSLASGALWGTTKAKTTSEANEVTQQLDRIEAVVGAAAGAVRRALPVLKTTAGLALLLHAPQLPNTVLLVQALRVSGLPLLAQAFQALRDAYFKSKSKLIEELPTLLAAKSELEGVQTKIKKLTAELEAAAATAKSEGEQLKKQLAQGAITKGQLEDAKAKGQAVLEKEKARISPQIDGLRSSLKKIDAAGNALKAIAASVEPAHLQTVAAQTYASMLSVLAVSRNKMAASVSVGLQLGQVVFDRVIVVLLPPHLLTKVGASGGATWLSAALSSASSALGVALATVLRRSATTLSACSLGGEVVVGQALCALDAAAGRLGLPAATAVLPASAVSGLQGAVVAAAAAQHLQQGLLSRALAGAGAAAGAAVGAGAGAEGRTPRTGLVLRPFLALEKLVTATFFGGVAA